MCYSCLSPRSSPWHDQSPPCPRALTMIPLVIGCVRVAYRVEQRERKERLAKDSLETISRKRLSKGRRRRRRPAARPARASSRRRGGRWVLTPVVSSILSWVHPPPTLLVGPPTTADECMVHCKARYLRNGWLMPGISARYARLRGAASARQVLFRDAIAREWVPDTVGHIVGT